MVTPVHYPSGGYIRLEEHGGAHVMHGPGGVNSRSGELLNANVSLIGSIQDNMNNMKVADNVELLLQLRENIMMITEDMNNTPGMMSQMPPLPMQMDMNLANAVLPPSRMSSMPIMSSVHQTHNLKVTDGPGARV